MTFRAIVCSVALGLGLLTGVDASAAPDCDGTECRKTAPAKPLNIMQFMREQAASTRAAEPPRTKARATADVKRPARRAVAAQSKPGSKPANRSAPLPADASASFASQPAQGVPQQSVPVVQSDELNAIDRAAGAAPAETVGAGTTAGSAVRMVDAEEFNDIDRKVENSPTHSANVERDAPARNEQANSSWLQWIWSAIGSTLTALATAVHHLIG